MTIASADLTAAQPLSLPNLLAFSTPGLCIGALSIAMTVYLPRYYAGHYGLGLALVGAAFGGVRLTDTLFDSFVGVAMDKTRTRLGRFRPWMMLGAPAMMLAMFLLFNPPVAVSLSYLVVCLIVYYVANSLILLSHYAWASAVAVNSHDRSRVFGVMQMVATLGAIAILLLPIVLTKMGHGKPGYHMSAMGWFIFAIAPLGIALAAMTTRDPAPRGAPNPGFTLANYLKMAMRPDMRRIIMAEFCLNLGPGWMSALYLFFFHDARGFSFAEANVLLLIYICASVLGAAGMGWLATRLGKHRTLMTSSTIYSLGLVVMVFLPKGMFGLVAVFMFMQGFVASSFILLNRAMVADVGDAVRLESGRNDISLLYSMITTAQKIALALSITLSFLALSLIGYQAKEGATNTPEAIFGMQLVYVIGPVFFVMLGGACFIGYELNAKRHAEIRATLDSRDAAAAV